MEQYKTKNKIFNSILEPVITQLQNSNFDVHPDTFSVLESTIRNIYRPFEKEKDVLHVANTFFDVYNKLKFTQKPSAIQWRQFIVCLFNILTKIDEKQTSNLMRCLAKCQNHLETLENSLISSYLRNWFNTFCTNICKCLSLLHRRAVEISSKTLSDNILLYVVQITSSLKILFLVFIQEMSNDVLIIESRRFLIKRFIYCFDGVRKILTIDNSIDDNPGFIQWMDNALDLMSEIELNKQLIEKVQNAKSAIEEVLCHAMSIAQICAEEDNKKIKGSIQTVLHELNQLETESNKVDGNPSLINLYVDIISDKLCILEQRVNTAVLNISLKVFSDLLGPLENLQNLCEETDISILSRSEYDLDDMITNFDNHVDCMIQVGLFAIACSTNTAIIAKIRSCLASLESLEPELIPALTALYMEPSKIACLHANLLAKHWLQEIQKLRNDVCFIIDPVAFGQVVQEEYNAKLETVQEEMKKENVELNRNDLNTMCKIAEVLISVSKASISDMQLNKDSDVLKQLKNLKDVHKEVCCATNLLSSENNSKKLNERIFKRLQILSTMIRRIISAFSDESKNSTKSKLHSSATYSQSVLGDETNTNRRNQISNEKLSESNLENIQNRGKQILKERSILYKTPTKTNKLAIFTPRNTSTKKNCGNRKMGISFIRNVLLPNCEETQTDQTMDLQITEILDELTTLADTLAL